MKIMIHGDSKMDNFLFKKEAFAVEDSYEAVLIDWQVVCCIDPINLFTSFY